jgi:hypothetical protein
MTSEKTPQPPEPHGSGPAADGAAADAAAGLSESEFEELLNSMDDAEADAILRLLSLC